MGRHEDPIPQNPNLYPEELQLKLYQAFIFSIPILFSIILFLLFYLFYLKRRANNNNTSMSAQLPIIQHSAHHSLSFLSPPWSLGFKGELKDKLQVVQFDEELKTKDALCCVCLGEFEFKEELRQLPMCKHVFHGDCIRHWLRTNATCPLCRCPVIPALKMGGPVGLVPDHTSQRNENPAQQHELDHNVGNSSLEVHNSSRSEEHVIRIIDEPSSSNSNNNN